MTEIATGSCGSPTQLPRSTHGHQVRRRVPHRGGIYHIGNRSSIPQYHTLLGVYRGTVGTRQVEPIPSNHVSYQSRGFLRCSHRAKASFARRPGWDMDMPLRASRHVVHSTSTFQ